MKLKVDNYKYEYLENESTKYKYIKDAVHLIYTTYQEAVDSDEILWLVFSEHFSHIRGRITKQKVTYSDVERIGRGLRRVQRLRLERGQIPLYLESELSLRGRKKKETAVKEFLQSLKGEI
jgi:polyribonucleotide nucleotidyltransferase